MSRKTALILTAALTMFVIVVAGALAVRLGASNADPTPVAAVETATVAPTTTAIAADAVLQREALYRQRLEEANAQLQQAYEQLRQLQAQIQQLQAQNATLLQREQIYQQRLAEANRLLQQSAQVVQQPWPSGPAGELEARRVEFRDDDGHEWREHEERKWRGDDGEHEKREKHEGEEWGDD